MKTALLLLALSLPLSAASYPSGDPTVTTALDAYGSIVYGPNTPMSGYPNRLERDPGGTTVGMWFCYLDQPNVLPACPDPPSVKTIPLSEWCRRLELLPMPSPSLPTDKRPVCLPEWR